MRSWSSHPSGAARSAVVVIAKAHPAGPGNSPARAPWTRFRGPRIDRVPTDQAVDTTLLGQPVAVTRPRGHYGVRAQPGPRRCGHLTGGLRNVAPATGDHVEYRQDAQDPSWSPLARLRSPWPVMFPSRIGRPPREPVPKVAGSPGPRVTRSRIGLRSRTSIPSSAVPVPKGSGCDRTLASSRKYGAADRAH